MDLSQFLGGIAALLAIASSVPYIISMYRGRARPHVLSWMLWGSFNAMAGMAQLIDGGGPGAWANLISAGLCWLVAMLGLMQKGPRDIVRSDWIAFAGAVFAIVPWVLTHNPLWSVIIITVIDMMAFYPTFRKAWRKPNEEVLTTYVLSALKHVFALCALYHYSVVTVLFSASLVFTIAVFIAMTVYRRRVMAMQIVPQV